MKKFLKVLLIVFGSILFIYLCLLFINIFAAGNLKRYINTFDSVEYVNQLTPEVDENGYVTFVTDDDFRVMEINDIHIGGGAWSLKKDKKSVYEVMTMIQKEKPDLVILNGDNVFAVPGPVFNGGGTLNNKMAAKQINRMFERLGVYYSTTFGNHDTEAFDYYSREAIGKLYNKADHCLFASNFSGYGVSNQCILLKNTSGKITKAFMLIDSNDYIDNSIMSSINWMYDTINDSQVEWAKGVIEDLSTKQGELVKSFYFFHIPTGEFETAYKELKDNDFKDTADAKYITGVWDELVDEELGGRVWYGGCHSDLAPNDNDQLFEVLGPDGIGSMEAIFVGHDHVNNGVVEYKGVVLAYCLSIDNLAYDDVCLSGRQRGATVITVSSDGSWDFKQKNAYIDYGVGTDKFYDVYLDKYYYEGELPKLK